MQTGILCERGCEGSKFKQFQKNNRMNMWIRNLSSYVKYKGTTSN